MPNPLQVVKVRASSLGELFDCPARWAAKHIHEMKMPYTPKSLLGKAVHRSTAVFDQSILDDAPLSVEDTAGAAVDEIYQPDFDVVWEDEKPSDVEKVALSLHKKYCTMISPKSQYKAVEVTCESLYIEDLGLILTGTTDRIVVKLEGFGIRDLKTGKTAVRADGTVETKGHAFQLGVYELLTSYATGLPITASAEIVGLNTGKTEAAQRVAVAEVDRPRDILLGNEYQAGVLERAADMIHSGAFFGNPRSMLCGKNYCPIYNSCNYRK